MSEQLIAHVDEETAKTARAKAERDDVSISQWVGEAVNQRIEREGMMSDGQRYRVEERVLDLVDDAAGQAADRIVDELFAAGVAPEEYADGRQADVETEDELTEDERARRRAQWGADDDENQRAADSDDDSDESDGSLFSRFKKDK